MVARGATDDFHLVFRDHQAQDWQLVDLPAFLDLPSVLRQFAVAHLAMAWSMGYHLIGDLHELKRVSWVSCLPTFRLAARLTLLPLPFETITGRRLATVMTLFRQPPL
jgi:hypothetical protein